jgi:glycosyltransferase involved in cell wall biosynthesis
LPSVSEPPPALEGAPLVVAHVLGSLHLGGAERIALSLAHHQSRQGHKVVVVSLEEPPGGPLGEEVDRGVELVRIAKRGRGVDLGLFARLAAFFAARRVEVVHSHNPLPEIYAVPAARLVGLRVVHTKHGPQREPWRRMLLRRLGASLAHEFVAVSDDSLAVAHTLHEVARRRGTVIWNGADLAHLSGARARRASARAALDLPEGAFVVGTLSRLVPEKRVDAVLRAVASLERDDVYVVVTGDGPEATRLTALAVELGLAARARFPGRTDDVTTALAALDVLALASSVEGLPLSLVEAMAAELAVVATRVGGVPEIVLDGETGLVVPPGDDAALASALGALANDRARAGRLAARGRARAEACFGLERMARDYLALYRAPGS